MLVIAIRRRSWSYSYCQAGLHGDPLRERCLSITQGSQKGNFYIYDGPIWLRAVPVGRRGKTVHLCYIPCHGFVGEAEQRPCVHIYQPLSEHLTGGTKFGVTLHNDLRIIIQFGQEPRSDVFVKHEEICSGVEE